jgi:hypothetical protein
MSDDNTTIDSTDETEEESSSSSVIADLWDTWKGKILVLILGTIFGLSVVSTNIGLELKDSDECDICLVQVTTDANADTTTTDDDD